MSGESQDIDESQGKGNFLDGQQKNYVSPVICVRNFYTCFVLYVLKLIQKNKNERNGMLISHK